MGIYFFILLAFEQKYLFLHFPFLGRIVDAKIQEFLQANKDAFLSPHFAIVNNPDQRLHSLMNRNARRWSGYLGDLCVALFHGDIFKRSIDALPRELVVLFPRLQNLK